MSVAQDFAYEGIHGLSAAIRSGETDSAALVRFFSSRIGEMDRAAGGPRLGAVLCLNPEAEAIAGRKESASPEQPLHGIPILVKDNIDTGDSQPTTAGSLALAGRCAPKDAPVVARLREAGAVILGKTNLSEWANFRSTHSSSGWSAVGGQTRNPHALDRSPSGSSSGSAAAVAAGLCPAALGTETDGSIVSPSAACGIVGLKPTLGALPAGGIVPIAWSQDVPGPMARSVEDVALLYRVLRGAGNGAGVGAGTSTDPRTGQVGFPDRLDGLTLGFAEDLGGFDARVDRLMEESVKALEALGAKIERVALKPPRGFDEAEFELMLHEFPAALAAYFAERFGADQDTAEAAGAPGKPPRTLEDIVAFNLAHADAELRYFGQELFELALSRRSAGRARASRRYEKARLAIARAHREKGMDFIAAGRGISAFIAPTGGPAWKIDHILGDHCSGGGASSLPATAGYPHLTVPMGQVAGLPVGLSIFGPAMSENTLLAVGSAFERETKAFRRPSFAPTAD